jgi:hypothetical protein
MVRRRFKSAPYVWRQELAFKVFGEIRPLMDQVVLRVWRHEDSEPTEIVCSCREVALREIEMTKRADMEEYEASARQG